MKTNTNQHTPGPWQTPREIFNPMKHGQNPETYRAIGIGNGASHVAYASVSGCVSAQEADANARLIAAAPALLAALENLVALMRNQDIQKTRTGCDLERHLAPFRAAIAQAQGGAL